LTYSLIAVADKFSGEEQEKKPEALQTNMNEYEYQNAEH